jgi:hypothetical protein
MWASFLEQMLAEGAPSLSGVLLTALTTVGLGGMVPRSLDGGRVRRCARREEALSGTMVAPSAGSTKFMRMITLKIAQWLDGSDDFCSVYIRYSLKVC